jgi:hypothetical protein
MVCMTAAWIQAIATILAVVVGALLSVYVRGQQLVKISEKRLDAYASLWTITKSLRRGGPDLSEEDLRKLESEMTDWYYKPGCGMLATAQTVQMFLKLRDNLTCPQPHFYPSSWAELWTPLEPEEPPLRRRQRMLEQQFSLLRTQMKTDCSVYYGKHISPVPPIAPYETDFLTELGTRPSRIWKAQVRRARKMTRDQYLAVLGVKPRAEQ